MIVGGLLILFLGFGAAFGIGLYAGLVPAVFGVLGLAWCAAGLLTLLKRDKLAITIGVTGVTLPVGNVFRGPIQTAVILREQIASISKRNSIKGRLVEIAITTGGRIPIQVRHYCPADRFLSLCKEHGLPVSDPNSETAIPTGEPT